MSTPTFAVSGSGQILHLNIRKVGSDDEKEIVVDAKIIIRSVPRDVGAFFDDALAVFLWRQDAEGLYVRNPWLSTVRYSCSVQDVRIEVGVFVFQHCAVRKFALDPIDGGRFHLTCVATITPTAAQLGELGKIVQEEAHIALSQCGLFGDMSDANAEEACDVA